jgi:hypothetical protein
VAGPWRAAAKVVWVRAAAPSASPVIYLRVLFFYLLPTGNAVIQVSFSAQDQNRNR